MAKQDDYIKTALRLPRELHADLCQSAQQMGRSLNADIISRLTKSKNQEGHLVLSKEWFDFLSGLASSPISEKPNLREPVNLSTVAISTTVKDFESGAYHHSSTVRNCAETQTGGFLELHAQINRLQEEVIAKGQRLSFMFDMHQEFMQRYEDLVRNRDNWQVLAEKNNGR